MKAVAYLQPGAIDRADALIDVELPRPVPSGRDLLVEVQAIAVNPVDTKVRRSAAPPAGSGSPGPAGRAMERRRSSGSWNPS